MITFADWLQEQVKGDYSSECLEALQARVNQLPITDNYTLLKDTIQNIVNDRIFPNSAVLDEIVANLTFDTGETT